MTNQDGKCSKQADKVMIFNSKGLILMSMLIFGFFCPASSIAGELKAKWTCIIYLAGDNFLDWFVLQNLEELRKAGSNHDVRAVVLADRTDNRGYLYEVKKDSLEEIPLGHIEPSWEGKELNTGDPQTLATFACWAVERFPAENYLLLLGGYGEGWMGLLHDFNDGNKKVDILDLKELECALNAITEGVWKVNGMDKKIDILGLDACYMGMVEVVSQLGKYARYVIASENEEPLDGWPYDEVLKAFLENPSGSIPNIASRIVDAYIDSAKGNPPTKLANILTISAIDTVRMERAMEILKGLALLLKDITQRESKRMIIIDRLTNSFTVSAHMEGRYIPYSMHYDLGEFARILEARFRDYPELSHKAQELRKAVSEAVVKERHQNLQSKAIGLSGLAIFGMGADLKTYTQLAFSQNSHWDEFIKERMGALEKALKGGKSE